MRVHPGHLSDVPGLCIAGLLQQAVNLDSADHRDYVQHCVYMMKFMDRWLIAMVNTAEAEWNADINLHDHELSDLCVQVCKKDVGTAIQFIDRMKGAQVFREDSLIAQVFQILTTNQDDTEKNLS